MSCRYTQEWMASKIFFKFLPIFSTILISTSILAALVKHASLLTFANKQTQSITVVQPKNEKGSVIRDHH